MESKKYQITVNRQQLRLIADCIEDCHRFIAGQTGMDNSTFVLSEYCDRIRDFDEAYIGISYTNKLDKLNLNSRDYEDNK